MEKLRRITAPLAQESAVALGFLTVFIWDTVLCWVLRHNVRRRRG